MPFKQRFLLLCGTAIFFGIALTAGLLVQTLQRTGESSRSILKSGIGMDTLAEVTVTSPKNTISLTKSGDSWWVAKENDFWPVRTSRIEDFIKSIGSMQTLRTVARNPSGHADLKIDDLQATTVELGGTKSDTIQALQFGALSQDGSEQYVREKGNPTVWAVSSGSAFWLQQDGAYWLDKRIWPMAMKPAEIVSVTYRSSGTGLITITKETANGAENWAVTGQNASNVKKDAISAWVQKILSLEGDDLLTMASKSIPEGHKEAIRISVKEKSGLERESIIYQPAQKDASWLLVPLYGDGPKTRNGSALAFKLAEWKLERSVMGEQ